MSGISERSVAFALKYEKRGKRKFDYNGNFYFKILNNYCTHEVHLDTHTLQLLKCSTLENNAFVYKVTLIHLI